MNKPDLLKRLTDIEWDDFEVKEAQAELSKNVWNGFGFCQCCRRLDYIEDI